MKKYYCLIILLLFMSQLYSAHLCSVSVTDSIEISNHSISGTYIASFNSGGHHFNWYTKMLTVSSRGNKVIDTIYISINDTDWVAENSDNPMIDIENYRTLSVFGSFVSFEYGSQSDGGMHPYSEHAHRTVNIALDKKKAIDATTIFPEQDLLKSFIADTFNLQEALHGYKPNSFSELKGLLETKYGISFSAWYVNNIFIDSVEISVVIPDNSPLDYPSLEIIVPIPQNYRAVFIEAKKNGTYAENMLHNYLRKAP